MIFRISIIIGLVTLLVGCAGIGVKNSPNPDRKLNQAYGAMNQGRFVPARRLISEAIEIFKTKNNKKGMAHGYTAYGVLYKWDPKTFNGKVIGASYDLEKSKEYFKKAIAIFDAEGDTNSSAKASFGLANAYKTKEACTHYNAALKKFNPNGPKFPINPRFKDFPTMVKAFKNEFCK